MILSGHEIKNRLGHDIIIDPFDEKQLNPNSYDVRLHDELLVYTNGECLDCKKENETIHVQIPSSGYILQPGRLYLGRTVEYTETHNLVPRIEGKSSIGRLGIQIHMTAGFGDVGFCGYWTLEITCIERVRIYPNMRIAQLRYSSILGNFGNGYQGKYQNSKGVVPSRSWEDFE